MKESTFRIILSLALIVALYYRLDPLMLALILLMAIEAVTNWRIPILATRLRSRTPVNTGETLAMDCQLTMTRFNFEAERLLRVVLIVFLTPSYFLLSEQLWFIPWFVAFALLGAGLSGVCPMVLMLRRLGFS